MSRKLKQICYSRVSAVINRRILRGSVEGGVWKCVGVWVSVSGAVGRSVRKCEGRYKKVCWGVRKDKGRCGDRCREAGLPYVLFLCPLF